jgi:hypothetical protein
MDDENPPAKARPSPSPSDAESALMEDENPPPKPQAAPAESPEPTPEPQEPQSTQLVADNIPLPTNPALPMGYSEWDRSQVESPLFLNAAINQFNERPIMLTGNWSIKPHLSIGSYFDGNIFLNSGNNTQTDFIVRAAPGVTMRLGDADSLFYMMADYTLGLNLYTLHTGDSTIDQDFKGQFQWTMPKTTVDLNLGVSSDTGQDVDISNRVQQEIYYAGLGIHHVLGDKTSWDASADYTRSDYNGLISSSQIQGQFFLDYQYSPKTQFGIGAGGGYLMVPGGSDQTFESGNIQATYRATGKLTLTGQAGLEVRQFSAIGGAAGAGESISPVFSISGAWVPKAGTELDLTLRRSIFASAILDAQDYTATEVDLTVRQRVTDYVSVSLSGGFVNANYSATTLGVNATREDNYFYVRPALDWKALNWLSVGFFYEYDQDLSQGGVANSFTRDLGGIDVAILF